MLAICFLYLMDFPYTAYVQPLVRVVYIQKVKMTWMGLGSMGCLIGDTFALTMEAPPGI